MITLADVLCGLEPGDKLTYRNSYGQELKGEVVEVQGELLAMSRPSWRHLGFGPEYIRPAEYELLHCHW